MIVQWSIWTQNTVITLYSTRVYMKWDKQGDSGDPTSVLNQEKSGVMDV